MASSSSGLPVSYTSSNTAVATISGSVINFVTHGTSVITASQAGDARFSPAPDVSRMLVILDHTKDSDGDGIPDVDDPHPNQQAQAITFNAIPVQMLSSTSYELVATAESNLPVSFASADESIATVSGNTVTFVSATVSGSTVTITASQAGDGDWLAATPVNQTLTIRDDLTDTDGDEIPDINDPHPNQQAQTITFGAIGNKMLSAGTYSLNASSSSGLPITYTSSNTSIATISGSTVTFVSATVQGSTVTITASQAGDGDWFAATPVDQDLTIFDDITDSDNDSIPDINDPYPNSQSQTITFNAIADREVVDGNLTLNATASSGLPVTYSTPDTNLLTINGNVVSFTGTGSVFTQQVSITASQAGGYNSSNSTDWKAAADVQQTFNLSDPDSDGDGIPDSTDPYPNSQSQTITFNAIADREVVDGNLTLNATASSGLPVTYSTPDTNLLTINGNVVSFTGTGSVFTQQVSITASQAGGYNSSNSTDWKAAADVQQTFNLSDPDSDGDGIPDSQDPNPNTTTQTITFPAIGSKNRSTNTYTLNATSTSGLPITYSSSNTSVATVSGSTVTFVANSGTTTITASQAGNDDYFPATTVSQPLTIIDDVTDTDGDGIPDVDDDNPSTFDVFVRNYPTSETTNIADSPHNNWDNPVDIYVNNEIVNLENGTTTLGENFTFEDFGQFTGRGLKLIRTWSTIEGALNGGGSWTQPYENWGSHNDVSYGTSTTMFHLNPNLTISHVLGLYAPAGPLEACCGDGTPTYAAGSSDHIKLDGGNATFDLVNGSNFSSTTLADDGHNVYRSYWNNLSGDDYAYVTPPKPDSRIVAAFLIGFKYTWVKPDNTTVDTSLYFRLNFV